MQFDKENFKVRLDLFIRQWLITSQVLLNQGLTRDAASETMDTFFSATCLALFETRYAGVIMHGTHEPFKAFTQVIEIGINQLNHKIGLVRSSGVNPIIGMTREQLLIKETSEAIAEDIEELLKMPVDA